MMDMCLKIKKQKPLELPKLKYDKNFEDVRLLTGMPIIARINNNKHEIWNNELFTTKSIDRINNSITITDDSDKIV